MQEQKTLALRAMMALAGLSLLPIIGFVALDIWTGRRCAESTVAKGRLDGAIAWRIGRVDCEGVAWPFYDVSVGAEGHALATAATSRGAPVPLGVRRLGTDAIGVTLVTCP